MKKLLVFLVIGMLSVGIMTACGNKGNGQTQSSEQTGESQIQETAQSGVQPSGGAAGTEENAGMDISNGWSDEMQSIKQAIVDTLGENYWPNTQITPEMLEGTYGVSADMYVDYLAEAPMISTNVDTLILIKAKEDSVEAVEKALNDYREKLVNDTMQYPMNIGKIQASRIERIGNYVCFVQLGGNVSMDISEEEAIKQCQEQNELVITIIEQNAQH
ncbi:MAG: DUF4358 domain-containing protein [Acetatifactor sp.]